MRKTLAGLAVVLMTTSFSAATPDTDPRTRTVTKTCNDQGGWQAGINLSLYCIVTCNANETGVHGQEDLGLLRNGTRVRGAPFFIYFQSRQLEPPLPLNRWYFYQANSSLNSSNRLKARDFSSLTVSIVCQPS
jgi:hypothetical protein